MKIHQVSDFGWQKIIKIWRKCKNQIYSKKTESDYPVVLCVLNKHFQNKPSRNLLQSSSRVLSIQSSRQGCLPSSRQSLSPVPPDSVQFRQSSRSPRLVNIRFELRKVWCKKKVSKFRRKFYLVKSCSIWFKLWHFLNKVFGKNMLRFQIIRTTFNKIKFCSEKWLLKTVTLFCYTILKKVS